MSYADGIRNPSRHAKPDTSTDGTFRTVLNELESDYRDYVSFSIR